MPLLFVERKLTSPYLRSFYFTIKVSTPSWVCFASSFLLHSFKDNLRSYAFHKEAFWIHKSITSKFLKNTSKNNPTLRNFFQYVISQKYIWFEIYF